MQITTLIFIAFTAISLAVYYVVPKRHQWKVLLVSSLVFFALASAFLSLYMIGTTVVIYFSAVFIQKYKDKFSEQKKLLSKEERKALKEQLGKKQKGIVAVSVIVVLSVLLASKYCNFFGNVINAISGRILSKNIIPEFNLFIPLGISYYSLMSISYVVDVYRGVCDAEKNFFKVLLYVCYFPHIMEGPFNKFKSLKEQFEAPHYIDYNRMLQGFLLVLYGFFKKLVIADRLGLSVTDLFKNVKSYSGAAVIVGALMYTIQLYMDFSGCIEVMCGVSKLFGIDMAENFRQPFFSKSVDEFWRRWHITLGTWMKEYVFYPISLSKHFKTVNRISNRYIKSGYFASFVPLAYSLLFVWMCTGLWHGASSKYVFYGLYYYFVMMAGKLFEPLFAKVSQKLRINRSGKIFGAFQIFRTFILVNIGMLIFESRSIGDFLRMSIKLVKPYDFSEIPGLIPDTKNLIIVLFGVLIVFIVGLMKEKGIDVNRSIIEKPMLLRWIIFIVLIMMILITGIYGPEFSALGNEGAIYAQF